MIGILGISHKTASLEVREKFAISQEEIQTFADELQKQANFSDIVVLSTCNRTEIYYSQSIYDSYTASLYLYNCLMACKKIDFNAEKYFYSYANDDAVTHLFKVCAGIDSMVIGEDQIIGQVKQAYVYCTELALTDAVLMRLFQKAFEAGKRVRTETAIKTGATSVSFVAVDMCAQKIVKLAQASILLIGTGETGKLALVGFAKQGIKNIFISNRTKSHTEDVLCKYNANFVPLTEIEQIIPTVDIVITATASKQAIITQNMIQTIAETHSRLPLFVDLGVPRNIETGITSISGAELICVDDLQKIINENKTKREACVEQGNDIIEELVHDFMEWLSFRALKPAIRAINYHLQKIYRDEYLTFRPDTSKTVEENIQNFSVMLTQKYSRELVKNLKYITENGRNELHLKVVDELFRK